MNKRPQVLGEPARSPANAVPGRESLRARGQGPGWLSRSAVSGIARRVRGSLAFHLGRIFGREQRRSIALFMAHGIHTDEMCVAMKPPPSSRHFDGFASNLRFITEHFNVIPLAEAVSMLEGKRKWRERCVVLTFDDSLKCMTTVVAPHLAKVGVAATFFVSTGILDQNEPYWWLRMDYSVLHSKNARSVVSLSTGDRFEVDSNNEPSGTRALKRALCWVSASEREEVVSQIEHDLCAALKDSPVSYPFAIPMDWDDVRSLAEAGMAVGSHTMSHDNLAMMSDDQAIRELAASKASIEEACGRQCEYLCYPYGMFHERTPRLVQQCGFTAAVSTDERGWNRAGEDRYQLKRFYMPEQRERLELMLSGLGGG